VRRSVRRAAAGLAPGLAVARAPSSWSRTRLQWRVLPRVV